MKWLKKKAGIKTTLKNLFIAFKVKTSVKAGNRLFDSQ